MLLSSCLGPLLIYPQEVGSWVLKANEGILIKIYKHFQTEYKLRLLGSI